MTDRLKIMAEPVKEQALFDKLSALALLGKVNYYQAKQATEDGDWEQVRRLIEKATGG